MAGGVQDLSAAGDTLEQERILGVLYRGEESLRARARDVRQTALVAAEQTVKESAPPTMAVDG